MSKINKLVEKLCPNGVEYYSIQDLCNITRGRVMSKDYIRDNRGEYPVYSSQTENNGELGKISTYDYEGEYLTWTTDGANAGSVFYRDGKFSVTNVCGLLKVINNRITTKFLYYMLSIEAPKYVNAGMGNPKLMSNVMARIKVAVPPLKVQCEIIHILDNFTLLSAELSAELKVRQKQYEYYTNFIFENLYENKKMKIGEFAECFEGATPSTSNPDYWENGTIDWMSSGEVNYGQVFKVEKKITQLGFDNCSTKMLPKNTVVIALAGQGKTRGTVAITRIELCTNQSLCGIVPDNTIIDNEYLYYYLKTRYLDLRRISSGDGTRGGLNLKMIKNYEIPVPSIEQQKEIVNIISKLDTLTNSISEGLPAEIEARQKQYEYYRDKLLTFKELKVNEG